MDGVPRVEERCEEHTRFSLLYDVLKEFIQNITWKAHSRKKEMKTYTLLIGVIEPSDAGIQSSCVL